MYIGRWWEVGWLIVWWFGGLTGLLFWGDAKLARERGLAGLSLWFDGTSVLGGRGIGAGRDSAGCVFRVCGSNDLRYKPVRVSQAELVRPLASPTN